MTKVWTDKEIEEFKRLYPSDIPVVELVKKYNASESCIYYTARKYGLKKIKERKVTPEMERFLDEHRGEDVKSLAEALGHVFLTYTSFIGYDNTFDGWIYYLCRLSDLGIKMKIYVILGSEEDENLLAYVLRHTFDQRGYDDYSEKIQSLEKAISKHEIFYTSYAQSLNSYYNKENKPFEYWFQKLDIGTYKSSYFEKGEKVVIKDTNEIAEVKYIFYYHTFSQSKVKVRLESGEIKEYGTKEIKKPPM